MFIFVYADFGKDTEHMLKHEYGHTIQSKIVGPLFLLVIGLPSIIWAGLFRKYRQKNKISYYSLYTEKMSKQARRGRIMEDLNTLLTLIGTGIALLTGLVTFAVKFYNAAKIIAKTKDWKKVMKIADTAMKQAEASGKSGADKKQMAIDIVQASCKEIGVELDVQALVEYIEEAIEFANNIAKK